METEVVATLMVGSVASAIAVATIIFGIHSQRVSTLMQVILHCNDRYAQVDSSRHKGPEASGDTRAFFRQFWGLKSDQFDYWLAGYVDHAMFLSWFYSVATHLHDNEPYYGSKTFRSGWLDFCRKDHSYINPIFTQLLDRLMLSKASYEDLVRIIQELISKTGDPGRMIKRKRGFNLPLNFRRYRKTQIEFSKGPIFGVLGSDYDRFTFVPSTLPAP
jgi:hypothetical protein